MNFCPKMHKKADFLQFCAFYLLTNARVQLPRALFSVNWQFQQKLIRIFVQNAVLTFPIIGGIIISQVEGTMVNLNTIMKTRYFL
jgi:hypothetical protein